MVLEMIVLQANRIYKSFGHIQVLNGAGLVINENERVGIVGPNGCGKSTLLGCISGNLVPDSGMISVAASRSVGYMQQLPEVDPARSAWDAVMDGYHDLLKQRQTLAELARMISEAAGADLERLMERYAQVNEAYERAMVTPASHCPAGFGRPGIQAGHFSQSWSSFSGGERPGLTWPAC